MEGSSFFHKLINVLSNLLSLFFLQKVPGILDDDLMRRIAGGDQLVEEFFKATEHPILV